MARAQELVIEVRGMTCGHCEQRVVKALRRVPGVTAAAANHNEGRAVVTADATQATEHELRAAIESAGYAAGEIIVPE